MSRIGITEDDKQRVLAIQEELNLGTQQDAMQVILDAADTAISLADTLECQPVEVADQVEGWRGSSEGVRFVQLKQAICLGTAGKIET